VRSAAPFRVDSGRRKAARAARWAWHRSATGQS